MQRKLFIIRHGKSSWESIVGDSDRPLTERGVKNSYTMAESLKNAGVIPEMLYSSPAIRALHTAVIMAKIWETKGENLHIRNRLYLPEIEDIEMVISEVPDDVESVAVFGHNPGFTDFANRFLDPVIDNIPTTGLVIVDMELDHWNDIFNADIKETIFDFPKRYK